MTKPTRRLVITAAIPFLAGCVGTFAQPLPDPSARAATKLRGVVLGDPESGERIEFSRVDYVEWTDSTLVIIGALRVPRGDGSASTQTRTFPLSDVGAVLVREVNADRTSLLIASVIVGGVLIGAFVLYNGRTTGRTVF